MIFAIIVFVIVMSFTIIGERRQELQGIYEKLAVRLVLGLIFAVAVAYPVQEWIVKHLWSDTDNIFGPDADNILANRATWIALGFGALVAAGFTAWLLWQPGDGQAEDVALPPENKDNERMIALKEENDLLRSERDQLKQSVAFWVREATAKPERAP
jgi:hypothetical protein